MPFKEKTRQFWIRVNSGKCAYDQYTEKTGFKQCNNPATHVHHIEGERDLLERGEDPEDSVALPLCKDHHVKNTGEVLGEPDASFHPDMGEAFTNYKEWKRQQEHMNSITGKRTIDYSTSPFADAARGHRELLRDGQRYINGDEGTDQYYIEKMRNKAVIYQAETGDVKPRTKQHPETDKSKKPKRWYDGI